MSDQLRKMLWTRLDDLHAGMLSAPSAPPRPMAQTVLDDDTNLWFITAEGTDIAEAAAKGEPGQFIAACPQTQLYAAIDGTLSLVSDPEKLDQIWSPFAAVWFDEGRDDSDIRLVCLTPSEAEVWVTDGNAKSLFEFGRAAITGKTPDVGDHGKLTF
ncbi:pyridoxamine 5'-phosphate oxidase family protein [Roseovarius aestuariivivens]|uniref:pyridoxamine 5'-phosphate oxidase family protein n=1 Tax=Roseovarius aestuariivivens TaxID=1888910 RepID=UPI0014369170|nr:pyridoxamine 5'-phosphate oxidase family protein [Roseovarius aestuariivivens]